MTQAMHIMVGVPGSGKSTLARRLLTGDMASGIYSSDAIRREFWGDEELYAGSKNHNKIVFDELNDRVLACLAVGGSPLIDATNLIPNLRQQWKDLADEYNVFPFAWRMALPFEKAKERNLMRDRVVPIEVMEAMQEKFEQFCSEETLTNEGWAVISVMGSHALLDA